MSRHTDPHKAVDYIIANAQQYAEAKAKRVYLEEFRKSKKALLMGQSAETTAVAREQYAYGHEEYTDLLKGLQAAIEVEEKLKFDIIAAQLRVDIWRTEQANARIEMKATQ